MKALLLLWVALSASACATTRLVGERPFVPEDRGAPRTVVLEPFFEEAEWQLSTRSELNPLATSPSIGFGGSMQYGAEPTVTRVTQDKPLLARIPSLATEHRLALAIVAKLRPSWAVLSTAAASQRTGPVTVVRVVVHDQDKVASNRALKNMAFAFGVVILPLQLFQLTPVEETLRVYGLLQRFELDASALPARLVKYPTQPDFAVNLAGLTPLTRPFGLDLEYEEGLFAPDEPRDATLIEGFAEKLAAAIIAVVEEAP